MQRKIRTVSAAVIALFTFVLIAPFSMAETGAVSKMAKIVSELNHYPSAEHKETLSAISNDESNSEASRTIATAIHNIEHKAKADDVAALQKVTESESATDAEKQLAAIVMTINHNPSPEAKKALEALAK